MIKTNTFLMMMSIVLVSQNGFAQNSLVNEKLACAPSPWPFKGHYKKSDFRKYVDQASKEQLFSYWLNETSKPAFGVLAYDLLNVLRRTNESDLMKGFFETLQSVTHLEKRPDGKKIIINERAKDHKVFVKEICELYAKALEEDSKAKNSGSN